MSTACSQDGPSEPQLPKDGLFIVTSAERWRFTEDTVFHGLYLFLNSTMYMPIKEVWPVQKAILTAPLSKNLLLGVHSGAVAFFYIEQCIGPFHFSELLQPHKTHFYLNLHFFPY